MVMPNRAVDPTPEEIRERCGVRSFYSQEPITMPSDELKQRVSPEDLAAFEALRKLGIDLEWTKEEKKQFRKQYKKTLAGQAHAVKICIRRLLRLIQTKTFMKYIIRGARWLMN